MDQRSLHFASDLLHHYDRIFAVSRGLIIPAHMTQQD